MGRVDESAMALARFRELDELDREFERYRNRVQVFPADAESYYGMARVFQRPDE